MRTTNIFKYLQSFKRYIYNCKTVLCL